MRDVIEARVSWGDDLLAIAHAAPRRALTLADFGLAIFGNDHDLVATREHGVAVLLSPMLRRDDVVVRFAVVERGPRVARFGVGDFRLTGGIVLAMLFHLMFFSLMRLSAWSAGEEDAWRMRTMRAYVESIDQRADAESEPKVEAADGSGGAKPGEAGVAGNPSIAKPVAIATSSRLAASIHDERAEAQTFGMIGLLSNHEAAPSAFATFGGNDAMGSIFGDALGDGFGIGGLALSGTGLGGGGPGAGLGLDRPGLSACGCGGGSYGTAGRLGGTHVTRAPTLRCGSSDDGHVGCAAQVNGRLPPEAVQRIVRQNFGRLRLCYESTLRTNPSAQGRVTVKFVIDRAGAVAMATASGDVDSSLDACVGRAFQSMSFPQPEGGIVTVVYPVVFES